MSALFGALSTLFRKMETFSNYFIDRVSASYESFGQAQKVGLAIFIVLVVLYKSKSIKQINMKKLLFVVILFLGSFTYSQESLTYQKPPQEILELAEAPLAPSIRMDDKGENFVFLYRSNFKTIEELSETEMRLGGLRINPVTNIGSRENYYTNIKIRVGRKNLDEAVKGLPENGRFTNFSWSPNQEKMAFTNTVSNGVELWVLDILTKSAKKITEPNLNANTRSPFSWFKDNNSLLIKLIPKEKLALIDTKTSIPTGPTISLSEQGVKAQNRTYQDLLKNPSDEHNFEQLVLSELYKVNLNGELTLWKESDMFINETFSPNGDYVLITTIKKPFSYLVPYYRFASETNIYDSDGTFVKTISEKIAFVAKDQNLLSMIKKCEEICPSMSQK